MYNAKVLICVTKLSIILQVSGDEVRIHSKCCKGVISFVGKGGAIRVQRGILNMTSSTFINNTARLLGTVYVISSCYHQLLLLVCSEAD